MSLYKSNTSLGGLKNFHYAGKRSFLYRQFVRGVGSLPEGKSLGVHSVQLCTKGPKRYIKSLLSVATKDYTAKTNQSIWLLQLRDHPYYANFMNAVGADT